MSIWGKGEGGSTTLLLGATLARKARTAIDELSDMQVRAEKAEALNERLRDIVEKFEVKDAARITAEADRDAHVALNRRILDELSSPDGPRRFSDPRNAAERAKLLEHEHRMSWQRKAPEVNHVIQAHAKESSNAKIREYRDDAEQVKYRPPPPAPE